MTDTPSEHPSRKLLLIGHGSEHDDRSARPVHEHAGRLRDRSEFDDVEVAFWKEPPAVEGAIERLEADEVVVVPVFTSQGYYAGRVIPRALGLDPDATGELQRVDQTRVVYAEAFGTSPAVQGVVASLLDDALEEVGPEPAEISVVVAGHGTPKDERSSHSTERLVSELEKGPWRDVRAGFMDESPRIDQAVAEAETESVILVPLFVSNGGHAAEDIPELLGASGREEFPVSFLGHEVHYTPSVGTDPGVASILESRALEALHTLEGSEDGAESWTLHRLMSEVVGSGPRTSTDMTREQALEAFERILDGRPEPETLGAFWVANRWKKNTPEELGAFLDAMDRRTRREEPRRRLDGTLVDCGAAYDGKTKTMLLGVASGLVSAELGAPVAVHSSGPVPTKEGTTYRDVLEALDVALPDDPAESWTMLEAAGLGYFDQRLFLPDVAELVEQRRRIGVRTFFNTVETLANPAGADVHLGSFYHLAYATKTIDALRASRETDFGRTLLFQGLEGYDDVRPGSTKVVIWDGGEAIEDFDVETADFGFDHERADLECSSVTETSARVTREVLLGERRDAAFDAISLNAAVRLLAAGAIDSLDEGVRAARSAIESGGPAERLQTLRGEA